MRALEVTERLPAVLQETQRSAIMSLLSERTLVWLQKMQMNPDKIPMSAAYLRFKAALQAEGERNGRAEGKREGLAQGERKGLRKGLAQGERKGLAQGERKGLAQGERKGLAQGERNALRMLLRTRGLSATAEQRAMIEGCTDPKKLGQWIVRAVSAGSVGEVLGTTRKPRTARPRTKQRAGK